MLTFKSTRQRKTPDLMSLRIAAPCPAEWSKMAGTDRVRHCAECNLKVYNFSAMTVDEIEDLSSQGGRLCARLYRRADGTVLTEDCPRGFRALVVRRFSRVAGMVAAALMSLEATAWQKVQPKQCLPSAQAARHDSGLEITVVDPDEALVPGAHVVLIRRDAGKKKKGTTGGEGRLVLQNLKAGDYVLSINARGFKVVDSSVILSEGKLLEVRVKLKIGEVASETIVVAEARLDMGAATITSDPATTSPVPQSTGFSRGAVPVRQ